MRTFVRSTTLSLLLATGLLAFGAMSAGAYATNMSSNYDGVSILSPSDTVQIDVVFDTQGAVDLTLMSVGVLFDPTMFTYNEAQFASITYALYAGGKSVYVVPAATNGLLRVGEDNQVNLDWISSSLPDGNTVAGSFTMGTLTFHMIDTTGPESLFDLCDNCPGNIVQTADGGTHANQLSGNFAVITPEPTTAVLVGLGLLGLGIAGRRVS